MRGGMFCIGLGGGWMEILFFNGCELDDRI